MSQRRECMQKMRRLKAQSDAIESRLMELFENLQKERDSYQVRYKQLKEEVGE